MKTSAWRGILALVVVSGLGAPPSAVAEDAVLGVVGAQQVDRSVDPAWHVYAFQRSGVRWIEVLDATGAVRGAVAYRRGALLSIPLGTADVQVQEASADQHQIYDDGDVAISADATGTLSARTLSVDGVCSGPIDCGKPGP